MTILLLDMGNTRIKYALMRGARLTRMRAVTHEGKPAALSALIQALPVGITRVLAVNVAGEKMERALRIAVRKRFHLAPEMFASSARALGVRNGYREPWRLGADRWLGVLAAHHLARGRAVLIANVGTALTIDAVTAAGKHLGGAIVPGPSTMVTSLLDGTHGIRRRAGGRAGETAQLFARDTASALAAGAAQATAALIDRAVSEASSAARGPALLILTGGGAPAIKPLLRQPVRMIPDLLLIGLAAVAMG